MMPVKYCDNPQEYCNRITKLIEKADDEWQNLWKSAVLELFERPDYSVNSINALLKVIEKAFKERTYNVRAEAFHCWQFFISNVERHSASEKLLRVITIPLCASNHSMKIVLHAKLETWFTLLKTNVLSKWISRDKDLTSLLKILYGPHSLPTTTDYEDLVQFGGSIYCILTEKFAGSGDKSDILSYLPKVVHSLSTDECKQETGKRIWCGALDCLRENGWQTTQFSCIIKSLECLLSNKNIMDDPFLCSLVSSLLCEYNSVPHSLLVSNLAIVLRSLFYSSCCDLTLANLLRNLLKKCKHEEDLLFDQVNNTLTEYSTEFDYKLQKCWSAVVTSFWELNTRDAQMKNCEWLLLFPVKNLHEKWHSSIEETLSFCFEILPSTGCNLVVKSLCHKMTSFLFSSSSVPLSLLYASTSLCRIILQKSKQSDDVSCVGDVLLTIFGREKSMDADKFYKQYFTKFLTCALLFVQKYPEFSNNFIPVTNRYAAYFNVDKNSKEVIKILSKFANENENRIGEAPVSSENSMRSINTPTKTRICDESLYRSSEKTVKSDSPHSKSTRKTQTGTVKSQLKTNEEEVQFIAIKPKSKESPMTEHQKKKSKVKSYIPALYEDLSQSLSHLQDDSMAAFPSRKSTSLSNNCVIIVEEDAVLPSTCDDNCDEIPASLNFCGAIEKDKSSSMFSSKKSLFKNNLPSVDENFNPMEPDNTNKTAALTRIENIAIPPESLLCSMKESSKRRNAAKIEIKKVDSESAKRFKKNVEYEGNVLGNSTENLFSANVSVKNKVGRPRKSLTKHTDQKKLISLTDSKCQYQNHLSVSSPPRTVTTPSPLDCTKKSAASSNTRRRSLRARNTDVTPRSPVPTRKRKSLLMEAIGVKKPALPMEKENEDVPQTQIDQLPEKDFSQIEATKTLETDVCLLEESPRTDLPSSPIVTVIDVENEGSKSIAEVAEKGEGESKRNVEINTSADSVIIIEDHPNSVVTIDSFTQSLVTSCNRTVNGESNPVVLVDDNNMESHNFSPESVFLPGVHTMDKMDEDNAVKNVLFRSPKADCESTNEISFDLQLFQTEQKDSTELSDKQAQIIQFENELMSKKSNVNDDVDVEERGPYLEGAAETSYEKEAKGTASENSRANVDNSSPMAANSRTSQMMKLIFGSQNMMKQKRKNGVVVQSLISSVNSSISRTTTNSRTMKMLQVNGHVETVAKHSPSKGVSLSEKVEKFKYTPKECTSPGILKKSNLVNTCSPRSPKSVNFAERLTDTREYQVDESNHSDSWSGSDNQSSNNLLSDEEATSQDTLYPVLHNCNDDIKNITVRLNLNQQQLDTFRRMGIDTVGQLASASTIVGKSIPVGDNRIQRLRAALQAYDNDRKLKGLRAPSVRRKILYKSQEKQLDVNSIIEILNETDNLVCENAAHVPQIRDDLLKLCQPTVVITKLKEEVSKSSESSSSQINETSTSSPVDDKVPSPCRVTRSHLSPSKMNDAAHSTFARITRSLLNSPTKSDHHSPSTPTEDVSNSPGPSDQFLHPSPSKACTHVVLLPTSNDDCRLSPVAANHIELQAISPTSECFVENSASDSVSQIQNDSEIRIHVESTNKTPSVDCFTEQNRQEFAAHDAYDAEIIYSNDNDNDILNSNVNRLATALDSLRSPIKPVNRVPQKTASPEIVYNETSETFVSQNEDLSQKKSLLVNDNNSSKELSMSIFSQDITKGADDVETSTVSSSLITAGSKNEVLAHADQSSNSFKKTCIAFANSFIELFTLSDYRDAEMDEKMLQLCEKYWDCDEKITKARVLFKR